MDQLIKQFDNWESAEPEAILAWMSEDVTELNSNYQDANDLMKLFGVEVINQLCEALETRGLKLVTMALVNGIDFGSPAIQDMLDDLADIQDFSPYISILSTLKSLGQVTNTRWVREYGDTALPTADEIRAGVILLKSNQAKEIVIDWRNTILLPLVDSKINEGKSIAEIKQEITKD